MKFNTKIIFMEKYTKNNSAEQEKASTTNLRIFGLGLVAVIVLDRKSTRLNSSHTTVSRMPSSA